MAGVIALALPWPAIGACPPVKGWASHYQNATVFRDRIRNGQLDGLERPGTTCDDGRFDPPKGTARLLLTGGTELTTGRTNPFLFGASAASKGIGALSTLWQVLRDSKTNEKTIRRMFGLKKNLKLVAYKPQCPSNAAGKPLVWLRLDAQLETLLQLTRALAVLEGWPLPANPVKIGANRYADPLIARIASAIKARRERPVNLAQTETIASVLATLAPPGSSALLPVSEVIAALNQQAATADGATLLGLIRLRAAASDLESTGKLAALTSQFTPGDLDVRLQKLAALPCVTPEASPAPTAAPKPAPSSPRPTPKTPLPVPSTPIPEPSNPPKPPETPIPESASANAPVITSFSEDTGDDDSDGITNDNTPSISGTAPEGMQEISIYLNNTEVGRTFVSAGHWQYDAYSPWSDGQYTLTARGKSREEGKIEISLAKEIQIFSSRTVRIPTSNNPGTNTYSFDEQRFPGPMPPIGETEFGISFIDNGLPFTLTAYLKDDSEPPLQYTYKTEIVEIGLSSSPDALPGEKFISFRISISDKLPPKNYMAKFILQDRAGNLACTANYDFNDCSDIRWDSIPILPSQEIPPNPEVPLGENPFNLETATTHDFQFREVLRSARITDGQHSQNIIGYSGPGNLSFWWRVSSEETFDFLRLYVDGIELSSVPGISGEVDWQFVQTSLPEGFHVVRWEYSKDGSVSSGADAAWLDEITFTPSPQ